MRLARSARPASYVLDPLATRWTLALALVLTITLDAAPAFSDGGPAAAAPDVVGVDATDDEAKSYWQEKYRSLLERRDELNEIVETERELYADANRRNYRRGKKRHIHRAKMLEAQAELEKVEAALAAFPDEARRGGALPGWLYEVEEERE